ncbi:MAG: FtsQ-type POTRA domain-containing protein [Gammaproteobacteria bacterium]|jgi:cell division protein FtsQ|nr:FtsQ-type POTRA domain-containing protein [Gammaproteobacteria bacterium]|tara:strand:- start:8356 stop:9180 length:825 start_codon:yes stop_codon:yes gene_type:complete
MSPDRTVNVQDGELTDAMIGQRKKILHKPSLWVTITVVLLMTGVVLADQLFRPGRFTIERIHIHGNSARVDAQTVERTAWLALIGNYFTADLEEIENALVHLPGVYQAAVRRHWPDTLEISITEAGAIALWYATDGSALESRDYVNLPPDSNITLQPVLRSPTADRHTVIDAFLDLVSSLALLDLEVKKLSIDEAGDWVVVLQSASLQIPVELEIVVGRGNPVRKVDQFVAVFDSVLQDRLPDIERVDMRYDSGFAVQWRAGGSGVVQLAAYGQ